MCSVVAAMDGPVSRQNTNQPAVSRHRPVSDRPAVNDGGRVSRRPEEREIGPDTSVRLRVRPPCPAPGHVMREVWRGGAA